MSAEHPFAQYIRIIGKGPNLSRPLTEAEIEQAVSLIMAGQTEPAQLGAFLCLLRARTETPAEVAGFARAIRRSIVKPADAPRVDLDWPSYAGKSRQLPWYLLSALLLARNGVTVFMHGTRTAGRMHAGEVLAGLGVAVAGSMAEAADHLRRKRFAYLALEQINPRLQEIMDMRLLLGVRSPINTVVRQTNPFDAQSQILSVTHPNYRDIHRGAAALLGQERMIIFKGEGGEAERRPVKPCEVFSLISGVTSEEEWPELLQSTAQAKDDDMDERRLATVWLGLDRDEYAVKTITGTAALALKMMGRVATAAEAQEVAEAMWVGRDKLSIAA